MRKIYLIQSCTGTVLSDIIKGYTKNQYTHISISLDKELNEMYSFGRLNPYNPFWGGFVHEYVDKGTFARFYNTDSAIFELEVTDEQYEKVKQKIGYVEKNKESYKFNIAGLFMVAANKRRVKKNTFYCAEFVRYVLKRSKINTKVLPKIIKPQDFSKLEGLSLVYEGKLRDYRNFLNGEELQGIVKQKVTIE